MGAMNPYGSAKRDGYVLPWRGKLPAPADWRPAASLEDGVDSVDQNCGTLFGPPERSKQFNHFRCSQDVRV